MNPSSFRVTALATVGSLSVSLGTVAFLHPLRKGTPRKPLLVDGSLILAHQTDWAVNFWSTSLAIRGEVNT
jgi:hypothetical protein